MAGNGTKSGRAAVIGGGTMGAGIAQVLLEAGCQVVLVEADDAAAERARSRVAEGSAGARRPAPPTSRSAWGGWRRSPASTPPLDVDLVVEAIPEIPDAKRDLLAAAEKVAPPDALLASNTSSLSITDLAGTLERPDRFLGMHFFNPVPLSALVELVVGQGTAPEAVDDARHWVARLGKESIEVRDSPGFATSRLGVALGLEAIRMLEEGVATAADIDRAAWCSATATRWARCGSPTWSASTSASPSPSTWPTSSGPASSRPLCCGTRSRPGSWGRSPAGASTTGAERESPWRPRAHPGRARLTVFPLRASLAMWWHALGRVSWPVRRGCEGLSRAGVRGQGRRRK